jgi:hypothetical protein
MATAVKVKAVKAVAVKVKATPAVEAIVLTPATQRQIKILRDSRDLEKQAKAKASDARDSILVPFGEIFQNVFGVDAKGKRLVSIKVLASSEKIDWQTLAENDPELYQSVRGLLSAYIVPKGSGTPTIRVDVV